MKPEWPIRKVSEISEHEAPSPWVFLAVILVVIVAGAIIGVLSWDQHGATPWNQVVGRTMLLAMLVAGVPCSACYLPYEFGQEQIRWWNFRSQSEFADWRRWSQDSLALINSVLLTPEPGLASRMAEPDGNAPEQNSGRVIALMDGNSADPERIAHLFEKLLTPLVSQFNRLSSKEPFRIVLQAEHEHYLLPLQAILKKLNYAYHPSALSRIDGGQHAEVIDGWLVPKMWNQQASARKPDWTCAC